MSYDLDIENIVILVIDALRADRVGTYRSNRELTPTLDSLATDSAVFERAFACINTTDLSIMSLHTGEYPRSTVIHHGGFVS